LGGKKVDKNPPERGKRGTTRRLRTDGQGLPLGVAVDGAHRHDMTRAEATLEAIMITRPEPMATQPQHLGLATGDDDAAACETLEAWGYTAHMRRRGEAVQAKRDISSDRARRWAVERTQAWMDRFRRWLIRGEKKEENSLARLHFACAWITFRAAELFG
jgi:putative transposase